MNRAARLVIISGPVGVGKTTVANEVSTQLDAAGVPHTLVDLDALAQTFPRDPADPHGNGLALENLTLVWENGRKRGARNLLVARVVESRAEALGIARAVMLPDPMVVRLTASDECLLSRVRRRECGSGRVWHEERALALSAQMAAGRFEDIVLETGQRSVPDISSEICHRVDWLR